MVWGNAASLLLASFAAALDGLPLLVRVIEGVAETLFFIRLEEREVGSGDSEGAGRLRGFADGFAGSLIFGIARVPDLDDFAVGLALAFLGGRGLLGGARWIHMRSPPKR